MVCIYILFFLLGFNLQDPCKDVFTNIGVIGLMGPITVLITCDAVIYSYIGIIAMRAKMKGPVGMANDYRRFWLTTLKCFGLNVITILLLGPFVVTRFSDFMQFKEDGNPDFTNESIVAGMLLFVHQIVSPVFILASYKECRYRIAVLCCCCCKAKRRQIQRGYQQHYATYAITEMSRFS